MDGISNNNIEDKRKIDEECQELISNLMSDKRGEICKLDKEYDLLINSINEQKEQIRNELTMLFNKKELSINEIKIENDVLDKKKNEINRSNDNIFVENNNFKEKKRLLRDKLNLISKEKKIEFLPSFCCKSFHFGKVSYTNNQYGIDSCVKVFNERDIGKIFSCNEGICVLLKDGILEMEYQRKLRIASQTSLNVGVASCGDLYIFSNAYDSFQISTPRGITHLPALCRPMDFRTSIRPCCFFNLAHVIIYCIYTKRFCNIKQFSPFRKVYDHKIVNRQVYFLGDDLSLLRCDISRGEKLLELQQYALLITMKNEKISLREDILNELILNNFLLTNNQYVFLINPGNNTAKCFSHENIFDDGKIKAYKIKEDKVLFCIELNQENNDTGLVKVVLRSFYL